MVKKIVVALYNWLVLLSPRMEVLLRSFYWKFSKRFKGMNPHQAPKADLSHHIDFSKIEEWLRKQGVKEGDLLIVHSSYAQLECTGLPPEKIIDRLLALVGPTGTLCMPVIRKFKGEPDGEEWLKADLSDVVFTYNVKRTKVVSGWLPFCLMRRKESVVSKFPYNPMCALGPLAEEMMAHNLDGDFPSAHGKNSSWKYCLDHGAKICAIGTDLEHHNTMIHVAEEAFGDWRWPDEEWFDVMKFEIVDEKGDTTTKEVYNRKAKWGMLHLAGMNMNRDFKKHGIVTSDMIDGYINVGFAEARNVVDYLRKRNKKGYPYI